MSLNARIIAGNFRPYKGVSPSMIAIGAWEMYLKTTIDYYLRPTESVWAILGTSTHGTLEDAGNKHDGPGLNETGMMFKGDGLTMHGTSDHALQVSDKWWEVWDYKVTGSYKAMQYLGIHKDTEPVMDPKTGKQVKFKTGPRAGQLKTRNIFVTDKKYVDLKKETMQLNAYRLMYEQNNMPISRMYIEAIIRDGGLQMSTGRGVTKNIYVIPINFLDAEEVITAYTLKQKELDKAFGDKDYPKCSDEESWDGKKCEAYCDVRSVCKYNDGEAKAK
jgi:hypothetical protein